MNNPTANYKVNTSKEENKQTRKGTCKRKTKQGNLYNLDNHKK
jgi:hypothetical protein